MDVPHPAGLPPPLAGLILGGGGLKKTIENRSPLTPAHPDKTLTLPRLYLCMSIIEKAGLQNNPLPLPRYGRPSLKQSPSPLC